MLSPRRAICAVTILCGVLTVSLAIDQPPGQRKPLAFDPKLRLKWPGKPTESSQVPEVGSPKHYSASFVDKQATGVTLYAANVEEFPEEMLKGASPKELLAAYVLGSKRHETSRKEIEHGPKKYPGLEITTRTEKDFGRRLVVMAGSKSLTSR
jgi:hypothetical protein